MDDLKNMDNDTIFYLKQGDKKRNEIFLFLKKKYGEDITDRQRGYVLERLQREGLVEQKRYSVYGLTEEGQRPRINLSQTIYDEPNLKPVMKYLPLNAQKAGYRLGLDAVVSKYLLKENDHNWMGLILAGDTKDEKSQLARAIGCTFRFNLKKIVFYLQHTAPGEFGVRRYPKGKGKFGIDVSPALSKPLLILEEYDKVKNRDTEINVKYLLQGERVLNVEDELVAVQPVPIVLFNLQKGENFQHIEKRLGREYIRRAVVVNTKFFNIDYQKMDELGRKLVNLEKKGNFPHIALSNLKIKKNSLSERELSLLSKLLYSGVKKDEENIMDTNQVANLVLGRLTWCHKLSLEEAICEVAYDYLLTRETLGVLKEDWRNIFWKQSRQIAKPKEKENFPEPDATIKVNKKDPETLRERIKFQEEYRDEIAKLKKWAEEIEKAKKFLKEEEFSWEKVDQLLLEEGYEVHSPERCENALQAVSEDYKNIQEGARGTLKKSKEDNNWLNDVYIKPLIEAKERIEIYKKSWDQILERISNVKKVSEIAPIKKTMEESSLPSTVKDRLKEKINKKESDLEKEKKNKIKELENYVEEMKKLSDSFNHDEMRRWARDISEDLVDLDFIRREDDHFTEKDGESYALDAFDFKKCADRSLFFGWDDICRRTIDLLSGVKPTPTEKIGNFSFSGSQREVGNGKMPTWKKWALGLGTVAVIGVGVHSALKNRKSKPLKLYIPVKQGVKEDLVEVRFLREEGDWFLFQSINFSRHFFQYGQIWKLPHDRTQTLALLKPEYGGQRYLLIHLEEEEIIIRVEEKDEKIPINQVDKIIYQEIPSQKEVQPEISLTYPFQKPDILSYP